MAFAPSTDAATVSIEGHAHAAAKAGLPDRCCGPSSAAMPRVIVDTNILIGGLLMIDPADPLARLVDGMRDGRIAVATSAALTAEYREVWSRPTIVRRRGWSAEALDAVLDGLAAHALVLAPPPGPRAPDAGDQMLWDLLASRPDLRLITADRALLRDRGMIGRVVTAADIARLGQYPLP